MGAQQSAAPGGSQVVYSNETPIQFSRDVINHLADARDSPNPAPERQQALDAVVQKRIQSEMKRLQEADAAVRADIEAALERENLDRDKQIVEVGEGGSSELLRSELEEVQRRADRFRSRLALDHAPDVKETQAKLLACYRANPGRPLDCWEEVEHFKEAVSKLEKRAFAQHVGTMLALWGVPATLSTRPSQSSMKCMHTPQSHTNRAVQSKRIIIVLMANPRVHQPSDEKKKKRGRTTIDYNTHKIHNY
ncbi:hypothetical protein CTheo_3516 [Ceratobasidium theobromae]|uniref:Uncharacterized protein n=1 Tax=Ceratobasidium theobromae TaxID=1582974 RepID=A0A5N5QNE7_9AGAM|nr:hypothetical protein CTheo_3516 [Ceratobasidium theobromae]